MNSKQYLGDSVYVDYDGYHIVLTTDNGTGPSNTIYLDSRVLQSLEQYITRLKDAARNPAEEAGSP